MSFGLYYVLTFILMLIFNNQTTTVIRVRLGKFKHSVGPLIAYPLFESV